MNPGHVAGTSQEPGIVPQLLWDHDAADELVFPGKTRVLVTFDGRGRGSLTTTVDPYGSNNTATGARALYANLGDGVFREVTAKAGVGMGRWSWSSLFADLNNDGWQDLVIANGFITGEDKRDL